MRDFKFLLCLTAVITVVVSEKNILCYYSSWATYRLSNGKFDVSNINTELCTHVIYAFAGLSQGAIVALDPYLDLPDESGRDNYGAFTALKKKNPKLKTILAVGGWNEGSAKYSVMASTAASRKVFIDSAVTMLATHGFDGLDLDWEYPNRRDTVHGVADVENFSLLVKELRVEFDKYGWFLSSAVSSVGAMAVLSYNIPEISKNLDMINIMTYDMYGAWDPVTGHNAPLHKGIGDFEAAENLYTVDMALKYWISQGAPPTKLAVGVPFYGRTFTLTNPNVTTVRAFASGAGISGAYTGTNGFLGYNEFCYMLLTEVWNVNYDDLAKVPYAYSGRNWVSYDDTNSISKKIEYALSLGITNVMIWSIETDDFHGLCGSGEWPLLKTVNNALGIGWSVTSTTSPLTTTVSPTTATSTTASSTTASSTTVSSTTPSSTTPSSTTVSSTPPVSTSEGTTVFTSAATTVSTSEGTPVTTSEGTPVTTSAATTVSTSEGPTISSSEGTTVPTSEGTTISTSEGTSVTTSAATTVSTSEGPTISTSEDTPVSTSEGTTISTSEGTTISTSAATTEPTSEGANISTSEGTNVSTDDTTVSMISGPLTSFGTVSSVRHFMFPIFVFFICFVLQ